MENYYTQKLQNIIEQYHMQEDNIIDSTYISNFIAKIFQKKCMNKRIAIWGAGRNNSITSHAAIIIKQYASYLQGLVCLVDSAKEVQGNHMLGYPIIAPEQLSDMDIDLIIVASRGQSESINKSISLYLPKCEILDIYHELRDQGIHLNYNFFEEKSEYARLFDVRKAYEYADKETKAKKLKDLIRAYLRIKDFSYAFQYMKQYIEDGYDSDHSVESMYHDIWNLLQELKEANHKRTEDITVYFVDSVRAMDVIDNTKGEPEFHFIKDWLEHAMVFTNAFSTAPTTYESLIGILTQQYSYIRDVYADNFQFNIEEVPIVKKALENGMDIRFYVAEDYKIMNDDSRIQFDNHIHMTEKLWNLACNKAVSKKPVFSFAYIEWELHFPFLCGYLNNKPKNHGFYEVGLKDMSDYIEGQFNDCFHYVDKEFLFYEAILHDNGYSVFFSDHSQVIYDKDHFWPFFKYYNDVDRATHCMLAFQGPGIQSGIHKDYFSMIHFTDAFCKYIYGEDIILEKDEIVMYQYYNIHNPELRTLAQEKGYMDYVNGMMCFASEDFIYMVNIFGKEEVYRRTDLENNLVHSLEGREFIAKVKQKFHTDFPDFLLRRAEDSIK